jgi:hypothetical protein
MENTRARHESLGKCNKDKGERGQIKRERNHEVVKDILAMGVYITKERAYYRAGLCHITGGGTRQARARGERGKGG